MADSAASVSQGPGAEAREGGLAPARVAVVTGAGSGIGRAVALELARAGWSLVLAGRRPEPLDETARMAVEPSAAGEGAPAVRTALPVPTDVTSPDSVAALFEAVREAHGRVDLLFNNAGITAPPVPLEKLSVSDWKAVVDTNLTGVFLCAREALRMMKTQEPRGGRIINNGSISAHTPRPDSAPYTATKHAVTGLTKSIALDGRPYGIACGQVDVGNAVTQLTRDMAAGVPQADGTVQAEATMDVAEVARAVAYMASLPLEANVLFMTVMATGMPFVGRG